MKRELLKIERMGLILLTAGMMTASLSGCGSKEEIKVVKQLDLEINYKNLKSDIKAEDGTILADIDITYPVIANIGDSEALAKINNYYKSLAEVYIENTKASAKEMAVEDKKMAIENQLEFMAHQYEMKIELFYKDNDVISFSTLEYMNTGGAHPNSLKMGETFSIATGDKMTLDQVMGLEHDKALEVIYKKVASAIKKTEGTDAFYYDENYKELIREAYNPNDFLVSDRGMTVFYQVYAIAPYAAGYPTFELSREDIGIGYIVSKK